EKTNTGVSFKSNVFPIIQAKCLPCHSEDNFNPSELSLDSYDLMAKGGKHGAPFKAGKSGESLLIEKTSDDPPFGDKMPLNSKKKIREGRAVWLTPDEIKTIATWIDQGAKNN
ncbi:MAG: c-type cytochrome domain-containing protein, partial [bacterium]